CAIGPSGNWIHWSFDVW
nr:immunoglobulin heavy chain junction region [Macaca mulatta]MOX60768.1 immunoglobulin heavy chain junction region [Macaca mulatta]MOX60885.1 immunoglobulin heavy chain junction region [Macaca mulatta]MOX62165.1 immunoglobulin heavy chain junction region [Macaca mulatta]MOX63770.1 immunoglobulin heavy chain junction region [Macaca mulatta]